MSADFYQLLEVDRTAGADEIKRAYRKRARELHPDANPDDPEAEDMFKQVSHAYEVLSDPETRSRYDRFGDAGISGAGSGGGSDPFGGGGGFGDIFEAFFGGGGGVRRQAGPPRGQDLEVTARVDLMAVMFGTQVTVDVNTAVSCTDCSGSGAGSGTQPVTCTECGGAGQVRRVRQSMLGQMVTAAPCGRCSGMGQVIDSPCAPCRGDGRIVKDVEHTVEVPAGINTGQTLRVSGRGAVGIRGGGAGDLYVHVRVAEHDTYRREEDDLVTDVVISIAQATLGTHLVLSTLDGDEDLIVPPGVQQGREFLLKGRGVPHLNQGGRNRGRGNLRAQIVIAVPTKLSDAERDLLTRFAEARGEHVTQTESKLKSKIKSAFL